MDAILITNYKMPLVLLLNDRYISDINNLKNDTKEFRNYLLIDLQYFGYEYCKRVSNDIIHEINVSKISNYNNYRDIMKHVSTMFIILILGCFVISMYSKLKNLEKKV